MVATGKILLNEKISQDFYRIIIHNPSIAKNAKPGQFVMVKVSETLDPFLKRPISISKADKKSGNITLIYQVIGRGTDLLAKMGEKEEIKLLGPLGNGFSWNSKDKCAVLIGGGCGIAPLVSLAQALVEECIDVYVLLGAQSRDKLICEEDFAKLGCRVLVSTDDGSYGYKGFVTGLLESLLGEKSFHRVYCCGPLPMIKRVVQISQSRMIPCEISLEERMACGIGACIGCVCKVRTADGSISNKKVCSNGPVFDAGEVILND